MDLKVEEVILKVERAESSGNRNTGIRGQL